jgi:hypothetical protein
VLIAAACTTTAGGVPPSSSAPPTTQPADVTEVVDETEDLPDLTARPITADDLLSMLPAGDTGVATSETPVFIERTNEMLITDAKLDRDDETDDIARAGRITGVSGEYPGDTHDAHVWIDLFTDTVGAHDWLTDFAGDISKRTGGSHTGDIDLIAAHAFPMEGLGDESMGFVLQLHADGQELTETLALFRMGRMVAFGSVVAAGANDARVPVQYLGEEISEGILDTLLQRNADPPPSVGPEGYLFEYRQVVAIDGDQWSTTAEGVVEGFDVSCRVRLDRPDVSADREYVVVDGRVWSRTSGQGDYTETAGAGVLDQTLLAYCPLWPIDLFEAGLGDVAQGTPAQHEVGGVAALGYRGEAEHLAAALGSRLDDIEVEVFNVWVAEGSTWLVELDTSLTGDSADLAQLIGPGYPEGTARVSMRHRVSNIGGAEATVTPPG